MIKICSKCHIEKNIEEFHRDKSTKDGFKNSCKNCINEYRIKNREKISLLGHNYYVNNKEKIKDRQAAYYLDNIEKIKNRERLYRIKNKEKIKQHKHGYRIKNREKISKQKKIYGENNKEKINETKRKYVEKNIEKVRDYRRSYYIKNKEKHSKYQKEYNKNKKYSTIYTKNRLKTDVNFKLQFNLRARLRVAVKNNYKSGSAVRDLGCSIEEFKKYMESLFKPGMSWENWGYGDDKWNIDHKIPLKHFNLSNREELLKACHYTNMQPLWQKDNLSKHDKLDTIYN